MQITNNWSPCGDRCTLRSASDRRHSGAIARLAAAGTVVGMLASIVVAPWLARITPDHEPVALWVWVAAPLVLIAVVVLASALPPAAH